MRIMNEEQSIQNDIRVKLAQAGYVVFRANVGKVKTADGRFFDTGLPTGFSDLFGYIPSNGRIFFLEVKTQRGKRRKDQIQFARNLRDKNVIYGVVRSAQEALYVVSHESRYLDDNNR